MEPEGVLLRLMGYGHKVVGSHRAETALWHLAEVERALTWCGLDVGYGNPRRRWSETPENQRCELCIDYPQPAQA